MFTGIVQCSARVSSFEHKANISRLTVMPPDTSYLQRLTTGASIAINGVCLTVVSFDSESVSFDLINETLQRSNLAQLTLGSFVNFERAAKWGDEIGGHLLSGHIQTQGVVEQVSECENQYDIEVSIAPEWHKYVLEKGYIAVDGISLTVGKLTERGFWLHIIPETLRLTTLGGKPVASGVNLEIDAQTQAVVDTVERMLMNTKNV
ncbi:riboflavin synthase subunit alpha [Corallincola holothuriorum]|uniref:Riboflavin synthase n=1 Tax=Corallincola holothuriorum TaxID=2282215 RepID=A0A368NSD3_9GAMM|nr:riboflavin synthase subunit alpha [Corallincola holothuriorum]RCU52604.1 riboflavin synthase subunit alpha [Corallincola holothuriorum]